MTRSRSRAARALEIDVIERLDDAEAVRTEWAELAAEAGAGPFSTPSFALAWWRHLGRGRLQLVVVRNGAGELVGLAPLHERRFGTLRILRWLGHGLGTVGELLTTDSRADLGSAIWEALADRGRLLDLTEYRHGGSGLSALRDAPHLTVNAELRDRCMTIDLADIDSVTEYLDSPRRRTIRKQLAKVDRSLAAAGLEPTIEVTSCEHGLPDAISAITPVFDAAELAHPRLHLLAPPYRSFLIEALTETARSGNLALLVARLDGRPVAFDVYVRSRSVAFAWLGRFDPSASEWSPGHVLLRAGLEWALDVGVDTIDLQLGADEYKRRWSTGSYDTLRVTGASDATRLALGRAALAGMGTVHEARGSMRSFRR